MTKIKLEDLNKDSTPCKICMAMNHRDIDRDAKYNRSHCSHGSYEGGSVCLDKDKAMIKLLYLNYIEVRQG